MNTYEGKSSAGSFQEALDQAIAAAVQGNTPDADIAWKVLETFGRAGTIAGVREVTVRIEAGLVSYRK